MKPEWIIYKNDQKLGQAVTWYKALDILVKQEGCIDLTVKIYSQIVFVGNILNSEMYRIVKER